MTELHLNASSEYVTITRNNISAQLDTECSRLGTSRTRKKETKRKDDIPMQSISLAPVIIHEKLQIWLSMQINRHKIHCRELLSEPIELAKQGYTYAHIKWERTCNRTAYQDVYNYSIHHKGANWKPSVFYFISERHQNVTYRHVHYFWVCI